MQPKKIEKKPAAKKSSASGVAAFKAVQCINLALMNDNVERLSEARELMPEEALSRHVKYSELKLPAFLAALALDKPSMA